MGLRHLRFAAAVLFALAITSACGSSGGDSIVSEGGDAPVVPTKRGGAPAVWMPGAEEMVIFGGMDPITNDTFSFDHVASAWRQLAPERQGSVPASRCHHTLTEVPGADQALLFGGFSRGTRFNDTWRFDFATETWTEIATTGTPPAKRCLHATVFVASRAELIVYGGISGGGSRASDFFGDTHILDVATGSWVRIEGEGPSPREGPVMVYARAADAAFLWGGKAFDHYPTELWRFDVEARTWSQAATSGDQPTGREDPIHFWDDSRNQLTIFSGRNDNEPEALLEDGYELDPVAGVWTRIDTETRPPPRWRASNAVDPGGDRGYMFGGWRGFGGGDAFNDTWRYDLAARTWTHIVTD